MKRLKNWLAVFLVLAMCTGFVPGVYAQTFDQPVPVKPIESPMERPVTDGPVTDGQDFVEPGVTPVMSRDEALNLAKQALLEHLNVDVDSRNFQLNTEYRRDWHQPDSYVWNLYWNLNEPMEYANASVTLDAATGVILDMNYDSGSYTDPRLRLLTLTREEAQQRAESFIETLLPGRLDSMRLMEMAELYRSMPSMQQYMFNYVRIINGAVYDANFVNIGIDGTNGEIKFFSQRWEEDPDLPSRTGIIDTAEARRLFLNDMQVELFYLPIRNEFMYESMPKNFRLAYRINPMMISMIDAHTGEPVDWSGRENELAMKERDITDARKREIAASAEPVPVRSEPMNQNEAEARAREYVLGFTGQAINIQSANYIEGDQYWETAGRQAWNFDFMIESPEREDASQPEPMRMPPYTNGRVMINALTGELIQFSWWQFYEGPPTESAEAVLTWEEAYDKAIEAIAEHHPRRIDEIRTLQRSMQQVAYMDGMKAPVREYAFQFPRIIDGILLDENHLSVGVNAETGTVTSYTDRWSDELTLPRANEVIPENTALQTLIQNFRLELAYLRFNKTDDYMNPDYEIRLIYRWMPRESTAGYPYIDAVTGVFLDYNGRAVPEQDASGFEAAISGHWVERTAKLLAQQGIIDTVAFSPDEPITRLEAVKMMVKARGTDFYGPMLDMGGEKVRYVDVVEHDEDYRYIQWAIRHGIIDNVPEEFDRDAAVTREQMMVLLARFMGYRQLAETRGIFSVDFSDAAQISEEALGSVAINLGLGTISRAGTFRPQDETTMAETAEMLFKAVAHQRR